MTTAQVNYLNIGFMILSCIIAFILPFELFLFSYAVLGPLHYLTEISWLHKRQFFTPGKRDYLLLGAVAVIIILPVLFKLGYHFWGARSSNDQLIYTGDLLHFFNRLSSLSRVMIFISFAIAATLVMVRGIYKRAIAMIVILALGLIFRSGGFFIVLFAIFLPTLIHVYLFTGIFLLTGTLKNRSLSGILSCVVFVLCSISLFVLFRHPVNSSTPLVLDNYSAGFYRLNQQIFSTFLHRQASRNDVYYSSAGILITRFIAFAYTYHYLNWFSKTSVIRWHLIPRKTWIMIISIWILSLVLYFTNYRTGFAALYFLSMLHVIFEFPLNFQSFRDIAVQLKTVLTSRSVFFKQLKP